MAVSEQEVLSMRRLLVSNDLLNVKTGLAILENWEGADCCKLLTELYFIAQFRWEEGYERIFKLISEGVSYKTGHIFRESFINLFAYCYGDTESIIRYIHQLGHTEIDPLLLASILCRYQSKDDMYNWDWYGLAYLLNYADDDSRLAVLKEKKLLDAKGESLNLQGFYFDIFPEILYQFSELKELNLTRCRFKKIPDLHNFPKLESLSLAYTKLKSFPPDIFGLTNLKLLDLSGNNMGSSLLPLLFPEAIARLENLEILRLPDSWLKEPPVALRQLPKLRELSYRQRFVCYYTPSAGRIWLDKHYFEVLLPNCKIIDK